MRRPQIAVIGSAFTDPAVLEPAEELGQLLIDAGWRIVCGGREGVMEAVCRGAHASEAYTEGATLGILPNLDGSTANSFCDIVVPTGLNFARNALVVAAGDVVVAVAGASGTLSEIALAWQYGKPIVALDQGVGWAAKLAGTKLDERYARPIHRATSPRAVIAHIERLLPTVQAPKTIW